MPKKNYPKNVKERAAEYKAAISSYKSRKEATISDSEKNKSHKKMMEMVGKYESLLTETQRKKEKSNRHKNAAKKAVSGIVKVGFAVATANFIGATTTAIKSGKAVSDTLKDGKKRDYIKSRIISKQRVDEMYEFFDEKIPDEQKDKITEIIEKNWPQNEKSKEFIENLEAGKLKLEDAEKFFESNPEAYDSLKEAIQESVGALAQNDQKMAEDLAIDMISDKNRTAVTVGLLIKHFEERNKLEQESFKKPKNVRKISPKPHTISR